MNPASNALTPDAPVYDVLETAISNYEQLAKQHYDNEANTPNLTQAERQAELKESLAHLENERAKLATIMDVQLKLEKYREEGAKVTDPELDTIDRDRLVDLMESEAHHPTALLEKQMFAAGVAKPSPKHSAHHIVSGRGRLPEFTLVARSHIHQFGIRINDPLNGVYLVSIDKNTPHWSMPDSRGHQKYHTHFYEEWVHDRITRCFSVVKVKETLQVIGRILQNNPPDAIKDKY